MTNSKTNSNPNLNEKQHVSKPDKKLSKGDRKALRKQRTPPTSKKRHMDKSFCNCEGDHSQNHCMGRKGANGRLKGQGHN